MHPDKPFDFAEKAYWLQRDEPLKDFVDQWLHISMEDGSFRKIYGSSEAGLHQSELGGLMIF